MSILNLSLVDTDGQLLQQPADVRLTHTSGKVLQIKAHVGKVVIGQLSDGPAETYTLQVKTKSYYPVSMFVTVAGKPTDLTVTLPIQPGKVRGVTFPDYASLPEDYRKLVDVVTYMEMDSIPKAGFLNICSKTSSAIGLDMILGLVEARGDRIFCRVSPDLLKTVMDSDKFHGAPGGLHKAPEGYTRVASFKTKELFGNLQITLFQSVLDWIADIDIDDAAGIRHAFQVVKNKFTGGTHPYNIREILVGYQKLNPGYTLHA